METQRSRLISAESLDRGQHILLTIGAKPRDGVKLDEVAERIACLLSPSDDENLRARFLDDVAGDKIRLALPKMVANPSLGVTQILSLLSVPTEYDHCEKLVFEQIDFPAEHLAAYRGPRFGVAGVRVQFGVSEGPLLGAILKPRLMTNLASALDTVRAVAGTGLDFVIDDELMVESHDLPFNERVTQIVAALGGADAQTRFVANVTARPSQALSFAHSAAQLGARGLVTNPIVAGFGALEDLTAYGPELPVFATNMGTALFAKAPVDGQFVGITEQLVGKLTRLAGADGVHGGIAAADWYATSPGAGMSNILNGVLGEVAPAFRIVAGGLDVITMVENWPMDGEPVIFEAGSAIFSHPRGPAAGARALRTALSITREQIAGAKGSRDLAKAALLRACETDRDLKEALDATRWAPTTAVQTLMRDIAAPRSWFGRLFGR